MEEKKEDNRMNVLYVSLAPYPLWSPYLLPPELQYLVIYGLFEVLWRCHEDLIMLHHVSDCMLSQNLVVVRLFLGTQDTTRKRLK